jgi:hypothetical protein
MATGGGRGTFPSLGSPSMEMTVSHQRASAEINTSFSQTTQALLKFADY